jgi:hypothetical protein
LYAHTESLLTLCNRHPANIPALITEIEWKLEQDTYLVSCIQDKLWEHAMEKQTYLDTFKHLKSLIKEGAESHNKLLEYRYSVKKSLATQGIEDQKKLLALQNGAQTPVRARKVDQTRGAIQTLEVGTMGNSEVSESFYSCPRPSVPVPLTVTVTVPVCSITATTIAPHSTFDSIRCE